MAIVKCLHLRAPICGNVSCCSRRLLGFWQETYLDCWLVVVDVGVVKVEIARRKIGVWKGY